MRVSDVMTRGVEFVPADATIQEAATAMAEHDIGAILVGSAERLEGILTNRDIILRVVVEGRHPAKTRVGGVMSSTLFTCTSDDGPEEALALMEERQVRRLPVLEDERVVGIVTRRDLLREEIGHAGAAAARSAAVPPEPR
ncbi:CBS domain-containing protein [Benzoatithermus flavus]|uniref:CBS domain-containing protein n=1 Tax=Benzoatithermus flavus TaxID=3108223 RepID=A0ABU8XT43_9PROT